MRPSSDIRLELAHQWSNFVSSWHDVQITWKDNVSSDFSKRFMSQWKADFPAFLAALESLETELRSVERELS